ncbi:MAG TPA: biopolymer transporter ExbD [Planctomycetaceae bacterium]|nr:biopolymer transporter ExbD [Planctomycetaceae bacterium]HIQ20082.1 biopolymer transporter ExbD [Planctomycetota bacterium]
MTIRFVCTDCGRKLRADDRYAGANVKCPRCAAKLVVPGGARAGPEEPAAEQIDAEPQQALRFGGYRAKDEGLDMTPMVDVTFLLLIFFMVTAAFHLQKAIEVPAPQQEEESTQARTREEIEQDDDYIIVEVKPDNSIFVEDREAPSEQELLALLREYREQRSSLMVFADEEALHEKVVMALDAGNAVGIEDIRLATVSEDDY